MSAHHEPSFQWLHVRAGVLPGFVLAIGCATFVWVSAALTGAVGLPRADDWAYDRAAFGLAGTGRVHLAGWGLMTLVGQLVWAAPWVRVLGAHVWVLDLSTTVLLVVGIVAGYALARRVAAPRDALVVVAGLAAAPGLLRDGAAFRTDLPALALSTVSMMSGVAAASAPTAGRRRAGEITCLGAGLWAFTIRQTAIAAPAAVLLVRLLDRRTRRAAAVQSAIFLAWCTTFWLWRSGLAGSQRPDGTPPAYVVVELLIASFFTFAVLTAPVLAWTAPDWLPVRHLHARLTGAAVGLAMAGYPLLEARWSWTGRPAWLIGDYLDQHGIGGEKLVLGQRSTLIPDPAWRALIAIAVVCGILLCALAAEALATRPRRQASDFASQVFGVDLALIACGLIAAAVIDGNLYDRYLWPALLPAGLLLVRRDHPKPARVDRRYRRAGLVVALALSMWFTVASDVFDAALWRAGTTATRSGYQASSVDAGFAWSGAHAVGPVVADPRSVPVGRAWWTAMTGPSRLCVIVAASPLDDPGLAIEARPEWKPLPLVEGTMLYVYRVTDPACLAADISKGTLRPSLARS